TYALRRVKDAFRENKNVNDPKTVEILLNRARDNLSIIQRQVSPPEETRDFSKPCWHSCHTEWLRGRGRRTFPEEATRVPGNACGYVPRETYRDVRFGAPDGRRRTGRCVEAEPGMSRSWRRFVGCAAPDWKWTGNERDVRFQRGSLGDRMRFGCRADVSEPTSGQYSLRVQTLPEKCQQSRAAVSESTRHLSGEAMVGSSLGGPPRMSVSGEASGPCLISSRVKKSICLHTTEFHNETPNVGVTEHVEQKRM
ncbi:hypothetical protein Z043_124298, partial [Scleropages formosus]